MAAIGFGASATSAVGTTPNVLLVAPSPPAGGYTSIQAAVDAASPGDWVLVAPGIYHEKGYNPASGKAAEVYITKPNLHLRGMDRNQVIVDGTNFSTTQATGTVPFSLAAACSSAEALQDPGLNGSAREGILAFKTAGVSIENLTSCNSLSNEIWWNNGDGSGVQGPMPLSGDYITGTSTFYKNASTRSGQYGIFTSNVGSPFPPASNLPPGQNGQIDHSYANNMTDSSYYIGACRDCNQILNHPHAENSALGLSTTNAGGNLLIENGEWDLNRTGMVSNAQNNDDYPSPQYGQCLPPSTPAAGYNGCDIWTGNYVHDNNNPNTPGSGLTSVSAVGAGIELAATQHITVIGNRIEHNGAWGVVTHDFPDPENGPANCNGGVPVPNGSSTGQFVCHWYSRGNTVANNTNLTNGFFGNTTNGDIANQASGATCAPSDTYCGTPPQADPNCYHGNTNTSGIKEWPTGPAGLQETPCPPGASETPVLTAQLVCATGAASLFTMGLANPPACPSGSSYPQHDGVCTPPAVLTPPLDTTNGVCFLPLSYTLDPALNAPMPDPCAGVPPNAFCLASAVPEGPPVLLLIGALAGLLFLGFVRRGATRPRPV
jgi:hypothetical protein